MHRPKQLTDVYLLALAVRYNGRLVTFDAGISLSAVRGVEARHLVRSWEVVWCPAKATCSARGQLRECHRKRSWTVGQLANTAALSRSAFFERFTKTVGLPPME